MASIGSSTLAAVTSTPFFTEASTITTPGILQTLITFVVPVSTTRRLHKVVVTTRQRGFFRIFIDATVVGSGRTGPAAMNVEFLWNPLRPAVAGSTIKIEFTAASDTPVSDIEAYLMASDI